jgi:hypothetical protein
MGTQLDRLAKAVHLDATAQPGEGWLVSGGAQPHRVREAGQCDCLDASLRKVACKHVLAVRLAAGDVATLRALRALVPAPPRRQGRSAGLAVDG